MLELLTAAEYAKRIRVHPETVRKWVRQGILKVVRLPHKPGHRSLIRIPVGKET